MRVPNVTSNFTPSVLSAINETGTLTPQPEQQVSSTPPPSSGASSQPVASGENTKTMSVIFDILNNPVSRGSDQNITITVADAASNESIARCDYYRQVTVSWRQLRKGL